MSLDKNCPNCHTVMLQCIAAEAQQRNGWYCQECKEFIKATGRERFLERGGNGQKEQIQNAATVRTT